MLLALGLFPLAVMLVLLFAACWIREGRATAPERPRAQLLPDARR